MAYWYTGSAFFQIPQSYLLLNMYMSFSTIQVFLYSTPHGLETNPVRVLLSIQTEILF